MQSASVLQRAERTLCAAASKSFAVQAFEFRAVRFGFAAGGTSWMCSGRRELCRATSCVSCSPLWFRSGRNELDAQRTARALPYKRLVFVQTAPFLRRAERAECAADGDILAV